MQSKLASNSKLACLQTIEITGLCHHTRQNLYNIIFILLSLSELLFGYKNSDLQGDDSAVRILAAEFNLRIHVVGEKQSYKLMLWHRANVCTNIKINVINFLKLYNQVNKPTHRIT